MAHTANREVIRLFSELVELRKAHPEARVLVHVAREAVVRLRATSRGWIDPAAARAEGRRVVSYPL